MNKKYQTKEFQNQIKQKSIVQYDPLEYENSYKIHQPNQRSYLSKTSNHFRIKRNQNPYWPKESNNIPVKKIEQEITRVQTDHQKKRNAPLKTIQYKAINQNMNLTSSNFSPQQQFIQSNNSQQSYQQYKMKQKIQQSQTAQNFYNNFFTPQLTLNGQFRAITTTNFKNRNKNFMNGWNENSSELEQQIGSSLSVKNLKSYCSELIENPKLFYSISGLGYKNYKYPRPPVLKDRMEKYTQQQQKNSQQQYLKSSNGSQMKKSKSSSNTYRKQVNTIEDICISKYRPDQIDDNRNNYSVSQNNNLKPQYFDQGKIIHNQLQKQQIQEQVQDNLQDLNSQIKSQNQQKIPKVRSNHCKKVDTDTRFYAVRKDLYKSIQQTEQIKPNKNNQNLFSDASNNILLKQQKKNEQKRNNNLVLQSQDQQDENQSLENDQQEEEIDINQQNLFPRVQGSKAKKINESIDTYNKLVKYSNSILSTQYNNIMIIQQQQSQLQQKLQHLQENIEKQQLKLQNMEEENNNKNQESTQENQQKSQQQHQSQQQQQQQEQDLIQQQFDLEQQKQFIIQSIQDDQNLYQNIMEQIQTLQAQQEPNTLSLKNRIENILLLGVFQENYSILRDNKRAISQRILLALDLNPNDYYFSVSLDTYMLFCTVLIHRTASIKEIARFVQKFFTLEEREIFITDFKSLLRTLTMSIDQRHTNVQKSLYHFLLEHFTQSQVIPQDYDEQYIDVDKFYQTLLLNKENTLDLLDLICGMS